MPIYVYMLYLRKMKEVIPNHHSKAQNVCLWPVEQLHYKQRRRFRWRNTWVDKVELISKVLTFTQFKYNTFPNFFIILPHLTKKAQFLKEFFSQKYIDARCFMGSWYSLSFSRRHCKCFMGLPDDHHKKFLKHGFSNIFFSPSRNSTI